MLNRLEREQSDIDEEVVHRLIEGEPVIATQAERMAAVKHLSTQLDSGLNADGTPRKSRWGTEIVNPDPDKPMTATEMARRIGVSQSTASRYLRMLAEPTRFLTMEESRSRVNILCARVIHKMTLIGWLIEKRH
jgi:DNA-binding transcriptional ArsR family regulator